LKAPENQTTVFRFVVRDEGKPTEKLDHPHLGESTYAARRHRTDKVNVVTPDGKLCEVTIGGTGQALPNGLLLAFEVRSGPTGKQVDSLRAE
jgi:hypothetical protein